MKKYIVKVDFHVLKNLFLKGDEIYIGDTEYVMDGVLDYGRRVYNSDRKYLGMVRDSHFYEKLKHKLETI